MIIETPLDSNPNLIERHSNQGVLIRKIGTTEEYIIATDYINEWDIQNGFLPYRYEGTEILIPEPHKILP